MSVTLPLSNFKACFDGLLRIEASIDHPACAGGVEQSAGLGVLLFDARRLIRRAEKGGLRELNLAELRKETRPTGSDGELVGTSGRVGERFSARCPSQTGWRNTAASIPKQGCPVQAETLGFRNILLRFGRFIQSWSRSATPFSRAMALSGCSARALRLAASLFSSSPFCEVENTEVDEVVDLQRIFLGGDLQRLDALIQIAHDRGIVVAGDVELLPLADIVAELVCAGEVFALPR